MCYGGVKARDRIKNAIIIEVPAIPRLWFGCTVAEKVTRTMSPLTQLWLTTKALAVSACAVGAAIALNTIAKEAITIYLIHRFCFIIYLVPILLRKETKPYRNWFPACGDFLGAL